MNSESTSIAVSPDWSQYGLTVSEQKTAQKEWAGVLAGHRNVVFGLLEMGEHLSRLKQLMEGKRQWINFCNNVGVFGPRTVRRYIENYERVQAQLHPKVINAAITEGVELFSPSADPERPFGYYQEAVKALPPPPEPKSDREARDYVISLREYAQKHPPARRRGVRRVSIERRAVDAFQAVRNAYKRVGDARARHRWAVKFIGYLMTEFGMSAQRFEPEAPPADWRRKPGRPARADGEE